MTSEFVDRLEAAQELVERKSVKRYIIDEKSERWVVVGNNREYLVQLDPFWCRCYDFQQNVIQNKVTQCKHNLAVQLAQKTNRYDSVHLSKAEFEQMRHYFLFDS